jgi:hypothetical protein
MAGRIDNQCAKILALLKARGNQGATNYELARIALKYTSRVSDIRKQGWRISCVCESRSKGVHRYHLLGRVAKNQSRLFTR